MNENITLDIRENKNFEAGNKLKVFLNNHQVTGKIRLVHKPSKSVIAESEAEINKEIGDSKTNLWNFNTENRLWEITDFEKSDVTTTINDNSLTLNSKDAILWWSLDSKTNNKAKDLTSNNLKGLMNDIKVKDGILGNSAEFSNSSSEIENENAKQYLNGLEQFTTSLWVKSELTEVDNGIFDSESLDTGENADGKDNNFVLRYDENGYNTDRSSPIKLGISTTQDGEVSLESSGNKQVDNWQHLAITWQSGSTPELYINGDKDGNLQSKRAFGSLIGIETLVLGRGPKYGTEAQGWEGKIDEFRIFRRAITEKEINKMYQSDKNMNNPLQNIKTGTWSSKILDFTSGKERMNKMYYKTEINDEEQIKAKIISYDENNSQKNETNWITLQNGLNEIKTNIKAHKFQIKYQLSITDSQTNHSPEILEFTFETKKIN